MSFILSGSNLSSEFQHHLNNVCHIRPKASQYNEDPSPVPCFNVDINNNQVYIPLALWKDFYETFPNIGEEHISTNFISRKIPYTIETDPKHYRDQNVVFNDAYEYLIKDGFVFLALPTGFGKTGMGMMLSSILNTKVAVLCHYDLVNKQWVEEFVNNSSAKVQHVKSDSANVNALDPNADVYIFGVKKVCSFSREQLKGIGCIIVDEAHIATITLFTKALLLFTPKYLIGLSATPKRVDGMDKVFKLYFGDNIIIRKEVKPFTVYKVLTPFKPEIDYMYVSGKMTLNWNKVVSSISDIDERHNLALSLVQSHPNDFIMILSDRVSQSEAIFNKLKEKNEHCTLIVGTIKTWDKDARVLVAGMKKAGVGFNDPRLTMLILMSDTKHVEQFEGRLRTNNCKIYDLVDDFTTFENHWKLRQKWYIERGATIEFLDLRIGNSNNIKKDKEKIVNIRLGGR